MVCIFIIFVKCAMIKLYKSVGTLSYKNIIMRESSIITGCAPLVKYVDVLPLSTGNTGVPVQEMAIVRLLCPNRVNL